MKVFTVGLDQKPPLKEAGELPEKIPPPQYAPGNHIPMGPEVPAPIVIRKSRGYKGILMVMLAVFLMALFALTLSEIAYNRQRDENFFRLRWAELKQRMGYGDTYDYYHQRAGADRIYSFGRNREISEALINPHSESLTSTTTAPSTPALAEPIVPLVSSSSSQQKSSSQSSFEDNGLIRDARLQFLKTILQKIKQHAEDMGFDGTMQVSVIEVEPQNEELLGQKSQQNVPSFFSHPLNPKSNAFLDGFGEVNQPSFLENNRIVEENRARQQQNNGPFSGAQWPHDDDNQRQEIVDPANAQWARPNPFFRPQWQILSQNQQPVQQHSILPHPFDRWPSNNGPNEDNEISPPILHIFPQQMMGLPNQMPQEPQKSIENMVGGESNSPSQEVVGEIYGRKFGRVLQDIIANRIQGFQQMQQQQMNSQMPNQQPNQQPQAQMGPRSFETNNLGPMMMGQGAPNQLPPMLQMPMLQQQQQMPMPQQWWPQQQGEDKQDAGKQQQQQPMLPPPPPIIFFPMQQGQRKEGMPQQQPQQPQFPQGVKNMVVPEDRIQIEPQTPIHSGGTSDFRGDWSDMTRKDDSNVEPKIVDGSVNMNGPPRAWTHQSDKSSAAAISAALANSDSQSGERTEKSGPSSENTPIFSSANGKNTDGDEDKWVVVPPNFGKAASSSSAMKNDQSSSSAQTVDFPPVKFPSADSIQNNEEKKPQIQPQEQHHQPLVANADAPLVPQNDQQQPLLSNPVFFQVDDPSAEQNKGSDIVH